MRAQEALRDQVLEARVRAEVAWAATIADPKERYTVLSLKAATIQPLLDEVNDRRALAAAEIYRSSETMTYRRVGELLGLSRSRAQQLVEKGYRLRPGTMSGPGA